MPYVAPSVTPIIYMPELMIQKIIEIGIWDLQRDPSPLNYIFNTYNLNEFKGIYGQNYIEEIKEWFVKTDIPVIQSWSFNPDRIPCISVHLNAEVEDIDKAGMGDYWGKSADDSDVGVGVFNVSLTLGVHAAKNGNYVLWLYYILHHIFFTYKLFIEKMGLQLHTYTGGDYIHDQKYIANNIWSRWVNFNCVVQNYWTTLSQQDYEIKLKGYLDRAIVSTEDGIVSGTDPILVFDRKLTK